MKRSCSLKGKRCFDQVFQSGKRFRERGFQCIVLRQCEIGKTPCPKNNQICSYKIGIVIGRRYGNACERNKAKRRVRAMIDEMAPQLVGKWCLAIKIFDDFRGMEFREGFHSFQNMLSKAGIFREIV